MRGRAGHHFFAERGVSAGIAEKLGLHGDQETVLACAQLHPDLGGMPFGVHQQTFTPAEQ